jgi:sulfate permease, SulP family
MNLTLNFKPKLLEALQGYNQGRFFKDLVAGLTVSVVALPLSMAFAIASGLKPEAGLITAIVGGFIISALGGSRVQIGGPAGAFIVVVYGIVLQHGLSGLMLATLMSGLWLLLMGVLHMGVLIRFIPVAVVIGFTNGIAVLIALLQLKDFLGLPIETMPADAIGLLTVILSHVNLINPNTLSLTLGSLLVMVFWQFGMPRLVPDTWAKRLSLLPSPMLVMVLSSFLVYFGPWQVDTLGSRFGGISIELPPLVWPSLNWAQVLELLAPSFTLAVLGAITSLVCARVSDGMIDDRHDPNQELMAQGIANLAMPFVGGMPATGAIARTVTNLKNGASSPLAGMVHSLGLLLVVLLAAPLVTHIPLGALSAILMSVAWNMGNWRAFAQLKQFRWSYRLTLMAVFMLTVLVNLTVAFEVGLLAACLIFVYRISSLTRCQALHQSETVQVWGLQGALFFGAVGLVDQLAQKLPSQTLLLDCSGLIYMDTSGADALHNLWRACQKSDVRLVLTGLNQQATDLLHRTKLLDRLGSNNVQPDWADTLNTLAG